MQESGSSRHGILKIILRLMAILEILGGLVLLFGAGPITALAPAGLGMSRNFGIWLLMVFGVLALGYGYLTFLASRDPVRYVGVIDALIFLLVAAVCVDPYAILALRILIYPALGWLVAREVVRLVLAIVLFALRPREAR